MCSFDPLLVRKAFPALSKSENSSSSRVYLDNAATTQKPQVVIDFLNDFHTNAIGNVHRASNSLSLEITQQFENARETIANFIGAKAKNIVFTKGATEGINLVANSFVANHLTSGDEIIITEMEHHSNIVPWQLVANKIGVKIIPWRISSQDCTLDINELKKLLNSKTKFIAISHMSNVTATRNPIEEVISIAHLQGIKVLVDGAQGIVHEKVDLTSIDADFYVFSGHKLYAPTGIGILYAKSELLESMPPWQGGGKMIEHVSFDNSTFAPPPARFEAGTPNASGVIALATAIKWLEQYERKEIEKHIADLQQHLLNALSDVEGINLIGLQKGSGIVTFTIKGVHHTDIATLLDNQGIAIRAGTFCAHPLFEALGINGAIRISIGIYNTFEDIDLCVEGIKKACELL